MVSLEAQNNFQSSVDQFIKQAAFKHANVGICLMDTQTGEILAAHQEEEALIPGSALKLLTTATAFSILGPGYQYKTELVIDGQINDGVLNGNVIIKGYGDPSLGAASWDIPLSFEALIKKFRLALQQAGIRKIKGYLIADDSYFSTAVTPKSWQLNDLGNYYAAGVHGLNIHENLYYLRFRQVGQLSATPPVSSIEPTIQGLDFINEIKSDRAGTGDNAYIYGAPFTYLRFIRGTIPVGSGLFTIKGAIPDPPLFLAQQLQQALLKTGISISKGATTSRLLDLRKEAWDAEGQVLIRELSPALDKIIERTNYKSVNLFAEALMHTLGKEKKGEGNTEKGLEVQRAHWESKGVDMSSAFLADGSGLSFRNAISAHTMAEVLQEATAGEAFPAFLSTIPLAGRTGSLRRKFRGTAAEGRLYAKSGTLARVRTYAGYIDSKSGKKLSFAVFVNNYKGNGGTIRSRLDRLLIDFCK